MANHKISVNIEENKLSVVSGIRCDSSLERARFCECGEVSFLPGMCRACGSEKRKPLVQVLNAEYQAKWNHNLRGMLVALLFTLGVSAIFVFFLVALGGTAIFRDGTLSLFEKIVLWISGIICVLSLLLQLVLLYIPYYSRRSLKRALQDQKLPFIAAFVLSDDDCSFEIDSYTKKWHDMVTEGYQSDITYLIGIKSRLDSGRSSAIDSYEELYTYALWLSYVKDSNRLAWLRLMYLTKMNLHQNAQTDMEQILRVFSNSFYRDNLNDITHIFNCVKCLSGPFSRGMVYDLMRMMVVANGNRGYHQQIVDVMRQCGPYHLKYWLENKGDFAALEPHYQTAKRSPLFSFQESMMEQEESA